MKLSTTPEQKRTAIVVDDDHDTVEVFSDLLQILQIKVIGKGYDGKDAVELSQKLRPGLVILDVYMPKYDGFYALEKIREINPKAKVMMITAEAFLETKSKLEKLKPTALVHKPTSTNKILEIVSNLMLADDSPNH